MPAAKPARAPRDRSGAVGDLTETGGVRKLGSEAIPALP
jgi:hypothetical protein